MGELNAKYPHENHFWQGASETTRDHEVTEAATIETVAKEDQEDPTAQTAPEPLEEVEAEPEVTEVKCEEPELSWFDSATAGDLRNLSLHATGSWV